MVFLFLGGFMIARAIEKFDIHKNIAARIVARTGARPFGVLLGFILATAFFEYVVKQHWHCNYDASYGIICSKPITSW